MSTENLVNECNQLLNEVITRHNIALFTHGNDVSDTINRLFPEKINNYIQSLTVLIHLMYFERKDSGSLTPLFVEQTNSVIQKIFDKTMNTKQSDYFSNKYTFVQKLNNVNNYTDDIYNFYKNFGDKEYFTQVFIPTIFNLFISDSCGCNSFANFAEAIYSKDLDFFIECIKPFFLYDTMFMNSMLGNFAQLYDINNQSDNLKKFINAFAASLPQLKSSHQKVLNILMKNQKSNDSEPITIDEKSKILTFFKDLAEKATDTWKYSEFMDVLAPVILENNGIAIHNTNRKVFPQINRNYNMTFEFNENDASEGFESLLKPLQESLDDGISAFPFNINEFYNNPAFYYSAYDVEIFNAIIKKQCTKNIDQDLKYVFTQMKLMLPSPATKRNSDSGQTNERKFDKQVDLWNEFNGTDVEKFIKKLPGLARDGNSWKVTEGATEVTKGNLINLSIKAKEIEERYKQYRMKYFIFEHLDSLLEYLQNSWFSFSMKICYKSLPKLGLMNSMDQEYLQRKIKDYFLSIDNNAAKLFLRNCNKDMKTIYNIDIDHGQIKIDGEVKIKGEIDNAKRMILPYFKYSRKAYIFYLLENLYSDKIDTIIKSSKGDNIINGNGSPNDAQSKLDETISRKMLNSVLDIIDKKNIYYVCHGSRILSLMNPISDINYLFTQKLYVNINSLAADKVKIFLAVMNVEYNLMEIVKQQHSEYGLDILEPYLNQFRLFFEMLKSNKKNY